MQSGWSSEIMPRPIGEVMNGSASASMSSRSAANGADHRKPLPTISSGRRATLQHGHRLCHRRGIGLADQVDARRHGCVVAAPRKSR